MSYVFNGVDAVGNKISSGDKVVYFRGKSGMKIGGVPLGAVFEVVQAENSGYIGRANVLVKIGNGTNWFCHEDLMVI